MALPKELSSIQFPERSDEATYTITVKSGNRRPITYRNVFVDHVGDEPDAPPAWTTINGVVIDSAKVINWWHSGNEPKPTEPQTTTAEENEYAKLSRSETELHDLLVLGWDPNLLPSIIDISEDHTRKLRSGSQKKYPELKFLTIDRLHEAKMEEAIRLVRRGESWAQVARTLKYSHQSPLKDVLKKYLGDDYSNIFTPDFRPEVTTETEKQYWPPLKK